MQVPEGAQDFIEAIKEIVLEQWPAELSWMKVWEREDKRVEIKVSVKTSHLSSKTVTIGQFDIHRHTR